MMTVIPHHFFPAALLLCALRSKGFPYSPAFIKKIVENTAAPLGKHDPFSIGHGIIQVCFYACTNAILHSFSRTSFSVYMKINKHIYLPVPGLGLRQHIEYFY